MTHPIGSDVEITRDLEKVDSYIIAPYGMMDGRGVSVAAVLLTILAEKVALNGHQAVLEHLRSMPNPA